MSDPVTVTVSLNIKPEHVDDMLAALPELQKGTRGYPGVQLVQALYDPARPTRLMFLDIFESREASEAYFAWRGETGELDRLVAMLSEPPVIEMWPTTIEPPRAITDPAR